VLRNLETKNPRMGVPLLVELDDEDMVELVEDTFDEVPV
jgi:hypothetical protein